jgi:peptidyl-prolyl cis-trans isomerase C
MRSNTWVQRWRRVRATGTVLAVVAMVCAPMWVGCRDKALQQSGRADAGEVPGGLTAAQAALVLAKVGDHEITLGEFAATLDRMDQFDRLRYQTPERRRELLDQIITVELLANEAKRRGIDKEPETAEALRQVLRDALLQETRRKGRAPADIPETEARAYYEEHRLDFEEPERRRVAHMVLKDKAKADRVLEAARKASPTQWGELALDNSLDAPAKPYRGSMELVGDLGLVGAPSDPRGANPRVPAELQKAAFELQKVGDVLDHLVQTSDGNWHLVRLVGKTDSHTRTFAEAERTIRITIAQRAIADLEKGMEAELRRQFPVQIDEAALAKVQVPGGPGAPNVNADAAADPH